MPAQSIAMYSLGFFRCTKDHRWYLAVPLQTADNPYWSAHDLACHFQANLQLDIAREVWCDWMVVCAVRCEPVSNAKFPIIGNLIRRP
jgi:hypothetical protein